jgi:hypothetical protein
VPYSSYMNERSTCLHAGFLFGCFFTQKMEAIRSSEMLVQIQTTRCYITVDCNFHNCCCENVISYITNILSNVRSVSDSSGDKTHHVLSSSLWAVRIPANIVQITFIIVGMSVFLLVGASIRASSGINKIGIVMAYARLECTYVCALAKKTTVWSSQCI